MKIVKVGVCLTLHSLSLHLKFPAAAFLQLQVSKMRHQILSNCELSCKPIKLHKEIKEQVDMIYNSQFEEYEQKRMNIVILIKTKNNPNKLTAGIIEIDLKSPQYQISNVKTRPSKCNDESAYLEYSLKTEVITLQGSSERKNLLQGSRATKNRAISSPKIITSAAQFKNTQMRNSQQKRNELLRLLCDSHMAEDNPLRRKPLSTQKMANKHGSEVDQSKTQRRSYGLNRSNELFISKKDQSVSVINQLNQKYETAKQAVSEAQQNVSLLTTQNKQLKQKIKQLQGDLSQQQTIVRSLNKKIELRENSSSDEVKQLKNKVQQLQTELQALLSQKNNLLNSMQSKEKQQFITLRQKESFYENKKDILLRSQQKQQALKQLTQEKNRLKQNNSALHAMIELLTDTNSKLQQKIQSANSQASKHKIELQKVNEEISQLEELFLRQIQNPVESKNQKKLIQDLQRYKDEAQLILKQNQAQITKLKAEFEAMQVQLTQKSSSLVTFIRQLQEKNVLLQALRQKQEELNARANRYEAGFKSAYFYSGKFGTHFKQVQFQLSKIKMEVENTTTTKAKKISDYEKVNQLLNKKLELLAQENLQLAVKYMELIEKIKAKEDQLFQMGQQVAKAKQNCMNFQVEVQTLREDNNFLASQIKVLDLREEEINKLREQIQYKDKLMEDLQHQHHLREIQNNNEIKLFADKVEQRQDQIKQLNDYIASLQTKELELHQQIQNLGYSIKNKEKEIQYIKNDFQSQRKNNTQFQQCMHILTATENASLTSVEQLRNQNIGFRNMIRENQQAINSFGKRYDNLFKGTVESLTRLFQILKTSKNIINQSIKHQKTQIATLLNDCIRFIGEKSKQQKEQLDNLQKLLAQESDKNRENLKLMKIKSRIQEQLESQIKMLQKEQDLFQIKLTNKENQKLQYQEQVKDKLSNIRQLNMLVENFKKQNINQQHKKDEILKQKNLQIEKLNEKIISKAQAFNLQLINLTKRGEIAQNQFNIKLSNQKIKIAEIQVHLKTQKQAAKLFRLKNADLEGTINKLSKQKQQIGNQYQKRTKQLIAAKVQSQFKSKLITQKQAQISQLKRAMEKTCKEKQSLQYKRNWLEEGNKALVINRNQLEQALRNKSDQLLESRQKISGLQQGQTKLSRQKQDLLKQRNQQLENTSKLNQRIKNLMDDIFKKQNEISRIEYQKQQIQRQLNKKISIIIKQKEGMQKHLRDFKQKQNQLQDHQTNKNNILINQLKQAQSKIQQYQQKIELLQAQIDAFQSKVSQLTLQMAEKLNHRLNGDQLGQEKRKQMIHIVAQLKILKKTQKNKIQLFKLGNQIENQRKRLLGRQWRELTLTLNQLKIKVSKMNVQNQLKSLFLQDIKLVQIAYENICKCSMF